MKNVLLILKKFLIALAIFVFSIAVLLLIFISFSPIKNFQVFRVMSGSMEPDVKTGSVVFVKQVNEGELKKGDIITFTVSNSILPVTHRIVQISKDGKIITKGDANRSNDVDAISVASIKGKAIFTLPYFGYISAWTKTPLGFIFFIIFPALLIIVNEILNIRKTVKDEIRKKVHETKLPIILILFVASTVISLIIIKPTSAFFSNGLVLPGNIFSTGNWVSPTPTPTTSPAQCKHKNAECQINNSNKTCCEGLVCGDFNPNSGNGKCIQEQTNTPMTTLQLDTNFATQSSEVLPEQINQ